MFIYATKGNVCNIVFTVMFIIYNLKNGDASVDLEQYGHLGGGTVVCLDFQYACMDLALL